MFYEPYDGEAEISGDAIKQSSDEWPVKQLRPRALTRTPLQAAFTTTWLTMTLENIYRYEEWAKKYGVKKICGC